MKRRSISLILCISVLICMAPAAGSYAEEPASSIPQAADGQIVVLYEDGEVDTDKPVTSAERSKARKAPAADSFGSAMEESGGRAGIRDAENTLGQQADILADSLGGNYVIEDTVVFDAASESDNETVVSVISSDKYSTDQMEGLLEKNNRVKAAEPNYVFTASAVPDWDDRYINDVWQVGERGINADTAWENHDINKAENPVVIAVMDTGIDYAHPDLDGRMWTEPEGFKLKGFHGIDYVDGDGKPMDENGHGTHCAGIIAAEANNAEGTVGVAGASDKVQLLSVRVLDEEGSGYLESIVAGFNYLVRAKKAGADIKAVNVSLGAAVESEIFDEVIEKAGEAGILTIAAAGNEMADNDEVPSAPANCKSDYLISVAALDDNGGFASYSNYGKTKVDVAAPGSNILSPVCYDNYMPFLYSNDTLAENTQTYGEFGGAVIEETTDADGNTVQSVKPVLGTDYDGEPITGIDEFGSSVCLSDKVKDSEGTTSLELTDADGFPIGNNSTSLRWNISNASAGDVYVLYFPYEKMASGLNDTMMNLAYRTHTEDGGGYGELQIGDVVAYTDKNGNVSYRTTVTDEMYEGIAEISKDWNSIWNASGVLGALYPRGNIKSIMSRLAVGKAEANDASGDMDPSGDPADVKTEDGFGVGFVYSAYEDGDVSIDISSLGISKVRPDTSTFGRYDIYSGTSMATPVVSGAVGLIAAMEPDADAASLRDKLFQTTHGGYEDFCSTGGAVDFAQYHSSAESGKPALSSAVADYKAGTVTLEGKAFGSSPEVTASFTFADKEEKIAPADITVKDGKIIIKDKYGLIGSEVKFTIKNAETGLTGSRAFYVVRGLSPYKKLFSIAKSESEDGFDDWSKDASAKQTVSSDDTDPEPFPAGLKYLHGANKYVLYDDDLLYSMTANSKKNRADVYEIGQTVAEAISDYAAKMSKKNELWAPDDPEQLDGEMGYYSVSSLADPVYMGNQVYRLIKVDMTDREAVLLMKMDINRNSNKWKICYDSLADFGSAPADINWQDMEQAVLGAYKSKLYLVGMKYTDEDGSIIEDKRTFACTLSDKGSKWAPAGELPEQMLKGKALGQGGSLYYFLGFDADDEVVYDVFKYDGKSWTVAGKLPYALFKDGAGEVDFWSMLAGIVPENYFPAAYGIDRDGLLFGGTSFDGGGDTFRFNTKTGKIQPLGYTLWGDITERAVDGTVAGNQLIAQYDIDTGVKTEAKTIPVTSGYVDVKTKVTGKGTGSVEGSGSHPVGESCDVIITPGSGSYIYEIHTKGLTKNFNKKYGKPGTASKGSLKTSFSAKSNASLTVHFGKISTKLNVKKIKKVKVGKRKLKASTNGTVSSVKWKSSNKKYAKVNKNGSITFTKKGIGKTVKLTATAKDNPKLKKTIKVKIVK